MEEKERLNKYLSRMGVCSRREADARIAAGRVQINGQTAAVGMTISPEDTVSVDGKPVGEEQAPVVLMLNKPAGIVCTAQRREKQNVIDYIGYESRIYPVGRLDKESRGLLLLTNQGDLAYRLTHARFGHEKEYQVTVSRPVTEDFIRRMQTGVWLSELEVKTAPCKVKKTGERSFTIILQEGRNRQIRRMCKELGYRVTDLVRIRFGALTLGDLKEGQWRELSFEEISMLTRKDVNSNHSFL